VNWNGGCSFTNNPSAKVIERAKITKYPTERFFERRTNWKVKYHKTTILFGKPDLIVLAGFFVLKFPENTIASIPIKL
jgi:folate-dependent phosphoribosylglycinamide formyltransferase PurN